MISQRQYIQDVEMVELSEECVSQAKVQLLSVISMMEFFFYTPEYF